MFVSEFELLQKSNVTKWSLKLQSLRLIAKRQTLLSIFLNKLWFIDFLIVSKEENVGWHLLPFNNQKIIELKLLISFTFAFKILDFI